MISKYTYIGLIFIITPAFFVNILNVQNIGGEIKNGTITSTTCDFFTNEILSFSALIVEQNFENSFYLITDASGQIVNTSESLNFSGISMPGTYYLQGLFYEGTIIVSSTGGGINTNSFVPTGAYFWSEPITFQVCTPIEICDNNIDDDGDGLIDNEDEECACSFYINFTKFDYCNVCEELGIEVQTPFWNGTDRTKSNIPNMAWKKPTTYSGRPHGIAANSLSGVNGDKNGNLSNSLGVITKEMQNPWWEVDLVGNFDIDEITVYAREDCCYSELNDYHIFISETPFSPLEMDDLIANANILHFNYVANGGQNFTLPILNKGRFIRIYSEGYTQLQIAEVEVIGQENEYSHPYSYEWSTPNTENKPSLICESAGQYCVTVTDNATACKTQKCINIP